MQTRILAISISAAAAVLVNLVGCVGAIDDGTAGTDSTSEDALRRDHHDAGATNKPGTAVDAGTPAKDAASSIDASTPLDASKPSTTDANTPAVDASTSNDSGAFSGTCQGVAVSPGPSTILNAVKANPAGTTFCIQAGTYALSDSIVPKDNQIFWAAPGAILNGSNQLERAFTASGVDGVTIYGFEITNFHTDISYQSPGVIQIDTATGWLIQGNTIHDCNGTGVTFANTNGNDANFATGVVNSSVIGNTVYNMGYAGLRAFGAQNVTFDSNDLSACNLTLSNIGDDVSTLGKFALTDHVVLTHNHVHDTNTSCIWFDIDNIRADIENNTLENCGSDGIDYEISFDATIKGNTITDMVPGTEANNPFEGSGEGIKISSSGGYETGVIDISGNTITNVAFGISVYQQNRGAIDEPHANYGEWTTRNVQVHNNTISGATQRFAALDQDYQVGLGVYANGNTFVSNTYTKAPNGSAFDHNGGVGFSDWQGDGLDTAGTCSANCD
jgi:hypothetical protein